MAPGARRRIVTSGVGLAPLRSLMNWLLARHDRSAWFRLASRWHRVTGCIAEELDALAAGRDIESRKTIDRASTQMARAGLVS